MLFTDRMKTTAAILHRVFLLLLAIHCFFIWNGSGEWRLITKLLLLPWLLLTLALYAKQISARLPVVVYAGLVFSFLGDLALTQNGESLFLLGMLAFILTHVCNSYFFIRAQKAIKGRRALQLVALLVLLLVSASVYGLLQDSLKALRLPVLVYMAIISTMAILATGMLRVQALHKASLHGFMPGAWLFVCSDALLALNKFLLHAGWADIAVMLTYGLAQYFLVAGFMAFAETAAKAE